MWSEPSRRVTFIAAEKVSKINAHDFNKIKIQISQIFFHRFFLKSAALSPPCRCRAVRACSICQILFCQIDEINQFASAQNSLCPNECTEKLDCTPVPRYPGFLLCPSWTHLHSTSGIWISPFSHRISFHRPLGLESKFLRHTSLDSVLPSWMCESSMQISALLTMHTVPGVHKCTLLSQHSARPTLPTKWD